MMVSANIAHALSGDGCPSERRGLVRYYRGDEAAGRMG
jgi:hypothetical protein